MWVWVPSHYFEACKKSFLGKAGWPFFGVETGTQRKGAGDVPDDDAGVTHFGGNQTCYKFRGKFQSKISPTCQFCRVTGDLKLGWLKWWPLKKGVVKVTSNVWGDEVWSRLGHHLECIVWVVFFWPLYGSVRLWQQRHWNMKSTFKVFFLHCAASHFYLTWVAECHWEHLSAKMKLITQWICCWHWLKKGHEGLKMVIGLHNSDFNNSISTPIQTQTWYISHQKKEVLMWEVAMTTFLYWWMFCWIIPPILRCDDLG